MGRAPRLAVAFALGLVAAIAFANITSRTVATVGPGTVELRLSAASSARTDLVLPPLGRVTAPTHDLPVRVTAEVKSLDFEGVEALIDARDPAAAVRREAESGFVRQLRALAVRLLVLSTVVGAVAAALAPGRKRLHLVLGGLGGATGALLLLGAVWRGYDVEAFERSPRFEGQLERAPSVLATVRRHIEDVDVVRNRIEALGARITELYTASAGDQTTSEGGTRILHVSDIHSNPLAVEVVRRLRENFDVDAVIDTGDLTSFGSTVEARIADLIEGLDVPYVLVPGNHDSREVRQALDALDHVSVLRRNVVDIGSVRVLGVEDPTFTADNRTSTEEANEIKASRALAVSRITRRERPDVLAVHDVRQAAESFGEVPLVIAGHTHDRSSQIVDGTRVLTVGSTGATGLGSFTADTDLAYEAQVLHFVDGQLVGIDYISLPGFDGSFTVEHVVVQPVEDEG
jgi:Icc-related predicted phosphoesterase